MAEDSALFDEFLLQPRVAYFSMEIALASEIPTYAGGLGVLAGDTMRSAVDLELPMVAVSLVSRAGYFKQTLDAAGRQIEEPDPWEPATVASPLNAKIAVEIEGRRVWVSGWLYVLQGQSSGAQPVILLDTDLAENSEQDRRITDCLYGGDTAYRLKQEVVLGIGGVLMLQALGFTIQQYHMNEGHSATLALQLLRQFAYRKADVRPGEPRYDIGRTREMLCFTTHTPIEASHDQFDYALVRRILGELVDLGTLKRLAGEQSMNMTALALSLSKYVNGVARRHAEESERRYPGYHVHSITNGVHPFTWTSKPFRRLYDEHLPGWCHEPDLLARTPYAIDDDAIGRAHAAAKAELLGRVTRASGAMWDPETLVIGFSRRMTSYKRPDLLFGDLDRLRAIAAKHPLQIVFAGKAHPQDAQGKRLIEEFHEHIDALKGFVPMVYLAGYDMDLARALVAGADVWLNTPLPPLEASGTSGMKAAFNGVPSLSVLDGWWLEGCIEGVTGWAIGDGAQSSDADTAGSLYEKLEHVVVPLYYADRAGWTSVMKGAISINAAFFNSHRMMRRYATEAYLD